MTKGAEPLSIEYVLAELTQHNLDIDSIGRWTEVKEEVLKSYLQAYASILAKRPFLKRWYIDGFAGAGIHVARGTDRLVAGSAFNAVNLQPAFDKIILVDLDKKRTAFLEEVTSSFSERVSVECGDANKYLPAKIFPQALYKEYVRAVCFLDPYKICLSWDTVLAAATAGPVEDGAKGTIEVFINFPNHDVIRNVCRDNPGAVPRKTYQRMTEFWGDEGWVDVLYTKFPRQTVMFPDPSRDYVREGNAAKLLRAYMERLKKVARYKFVEGPFPFRNTVGTDVFMLIFAGHNELAAQKVRQVFKLMRQRHG